MSPGESHNRLPVTDRPSDLIWHPKSSGLTNNFQWQFGQRQKFRNILSFIISTVNHLQYMTSAFYESYLAFLSFDSKSPWICSLIFRNPSVLRIWQLYIFTYNHKTRRLSGSVSSETERFTVFIWQCKIESTWRGLRHVSTPFFHAALFLHSNDDAFFLHERLPNLSNSKNKSFFGSKIANSFNFKDFAIFQ